MEVGNPHPTIYLQNLNEKVSPVHLKATLTEWLSPCGKIVNIIAKRRLALKGQAWILFDTTESARRAIEYLQGKRLYGKSVVARFARFKSDDVSKADGTFDTEKYHREQEKAEKARNPRPTRRQLMQQIMSNPALAAMGNVGGMGMGPMQGSHGLPMGVGSDMQLPNKTLFIQALPPGISEDTLTRQFSRHAGFIEVRPVPGRPDLAFVEYESEHQAAIARGQTDNAEIGQGARMRVSFARR